MGTMRLPLLILHILAGSIALLTGTLAIAVRKGGSLHRASGNIFTVAMLTLATSAFCLAILKSQQGNIVGSVGTFYLIGTAWLAGRPGERTRLFDGVRFSSVSPAQLGLSPWAFTPSTTPVAWTKPLPQPA
jgi:Predicted membrane protein (DUF2306)